jgi:DNA-binding CsgD family transcriptional regulator
MAGGHLITDQRTVMTGRDREVLALLLMGYNRAQIAATLGISELSIKINLKVIYRILGVHSHAQAIVTWQEKECGRSPLFTGEAVRVVGGTSSALSPERYDRLVESFQQPKKG